MIMCEKRTREDVVLHLLNTYGNLTYSELLEHSQTTQTVPRLGRNNLTKILNHLLDRKLIHFEWVEWSYEKKYEITLKGQNQLIGGEIQCLN